MISELFYQALLTAVKYHDGQKYNDEPYVAHCIRVSQRCTDETHKVVALLHDTLEDTALTYTELRLKFGPEIADAVLCMTRQPGEEYLGSYIEKVKTNKISTMVKLADLYENLSYLPSESQAEKYKKAVMILRREIYK